MWVAQHVMNTDGLLSQKSSNPLRQSAVLFLQCSLFCAFQGNGADKCTSCLTIGSAVHKPLSQALNQMFTLKVPCRPRGRLLACTWVAPDQAGFQRS